jgi:RNA polymerase sigma-70 factor (ECF subfamily)
MSFDETDEEIINLYKNGQAEVFKILINRYTSSVYNFIARLTNKNDATDLTQETFIKAWRNIKHFDEIKASFKTWIFVIAKNTTTDFLRKKKSLLFSDLDTEEESFSEKIPDENLLPNEILQKLQDSELLNKVLERLSLNYKTILVLHYQEEMTFDEIGKILDKPLNTVKSQHQRAIKELRKMLA